MHDRVHILPTEEHGFVQMVQKTLHLALAPFMPGLDCSCTDFNCGSHGVSVCLSVDHIDTDFHSHLHCWGFIVAANCEEEQ